MLQGVGEVGRGADAVAQVVVAHGLLEPLRQGLEVAPGQPAVGREALGEDQQVAAGGGELVVLQRQPAADVAHRVLLGGHGHAVGAGRHVLDDADDVPVGLAGLALLDEPGVLGEPAGVEEQRLAVAVRDLGHRADVVERDRLPATGVVGDGEHDDRHVVAPLGEQGLEPVDVQVALERVDQRGVVALGDDQVDGLGAGELDVGAGGVEVGVARHDLAGAAEDAEEDLFRGTSLVGGDDVLVGEEVPHRVTEQVVGRRARVGLVAVLDGGPLVAAHGAGPGVGEQVDQHVLGVQLEEVVVRLGGLGAALGGGRHAERLHAVDAERLDDGAELRLVADVVVHGHTVPVMSDRPVRGVSGARAATAEAHQQRPQPDGAERQRGQLRRLEARLGEGAGAAGSLVGLAGDTVTVAVEVAAVERASRGDARLSGGAQLVTALGAGGGGRARARSRACRRDRHLAGGLRGGGDPVAAEVDRAVGPAALAGDPVVVAVERWAVVRVEAGDICAAERRAGAGVGGGDPGER